MLVIGSIRDNGAENQCHGYVYWTKLYLFVSSVVMLRRGGEGCIDEATTITFVREVSVVDIVKSEPPSPLPPLQTSTGALVTGHGVKFPGTMKKAFPVPLDGEDENFIVSLHCADA